MKTHDQGRALLHVMEHLKGVQFGYAKPPSRSIDASLHSLLTTAEAAWPALDDATGRAAANRLLSAEGIADATRQHRANARRRDQPPAPQRRRRGEASANEARCGDRPAVARSRRRCGRDLRPRDSRAIHVPHRDAEAIRARRRSRAACARSRSVHQHAEASRTRRACARGPKRRTRRNWRSSTQRRKRRIGSIQSRIDAHGVRRSGEGPGRRGDRARRAPAHQRRHNRSSRQRARGTPRRLSTPRAAPR